MDLFGLDARSRKSVSAGFFICSAESHIPANLRQFTGGSHTPVHDKLEQTRDGARIPPKAADSRKNASLRYGFVSMQI
jgi:hypothetical protein